MLSLNSTTTVECSPRVRALTTVAVAGLSILAGQRFIGRAHAEEPPRIRIARQQKPPSGIRSRSQPAYVRAVPNANLGSGRRGVDHTTVRTVAAAAMRQNDPGALLRVAAEQYEQNIRSYSCTFWRQERVRGELTKQQGIEVLYREAPRTILMNWIVNPVQVKRCLYVAGHNRNKRGEECALVEPAGSLVRLIASKVSIPIHGTRARESSRHAIDEFGFRATIERVLTVNQRAERRGDLDFRIIGTDEIDGRATTVLERRLPYAGAGGDYPDARLIVHIDTEWLLPVAVRSYADANGEQLLASYTMTDVRLNAEFDDGLLEF